MAADADQKKIEHHVVSVTYVPAKDLPAEFIKAEKMTPFDFAEVRILNSPTPPKPEISKVASPARRVKEVLAAHKIHIVLD